MAFIALDSYPILSNALYTIFNYVIISWPAMPILSSFQQIASSTSLSPLTLRMLKRRNDSISLTQTLFCFSKTANCEYPNEGETSVGGQALRS